MSYLLRIFWLITLIFFAAGCSGYKVACCIDSDVPGEDVQDILENCDLQTGKNIRLNLVDGTRVDGVVQSFSSSEITLAAEDKNHEPQRYSTAEIVSIEKEDSYVAVKTVALILLLTGIIVGGAHAISNADLGWDTDVSLIRF